MTVGRVAAAGLLLLGFAAQSAWPATPSAPHAKPGEAIYRSGILGSGAPLEGTRQAGGLHMKGAEAACVNCHQRSGLGTIEGRNVIPPIASQYLFHPRATNLDELGLPYIEGMRADRDPYTEATLARAIGEGVNSEGKPLSYLMPRFKMGDADMAALIDYLKTLEPRRMPGATDNVLHFATIVTPDADPARRSGTLDVLRHYFAEKNTFHLGPSRQMKPSGKTMYSKEMFKVNRQWQLHVWELTGPPATWEAQLQSNLAREPVLAVISGAGGRNWAPVHDFCEREALPCLFPNVDVPVEASGDFYSLYFSRGVLLEAQMIARRIVDSGKGRKADSVRQIFRAGDSGEAAAEALAAALKLHDIEARSQPLAAGALGEGVAEAARRAPRAGTLVLWLRPSDLAALGDAAEVPDRVFMSGLLGGLEDAPLPPAWRGHTILTYPVDLPERRRVRVDYPLGWFRIRQIPVVSIQAQADTYLACGLLSETLSHMVDAFYRPYLVERLQMGIEHRIITGYYPRLSLATGQRIASKGGYLVHFDGLQGRKVVADSEWMVP